MRWILLELLPWLKSFSLITELVGNIYCAGESWEKLILVQDGRKKVISFICLYFTPHTSHLTLHTSCLTPHTSHLIPQTSHLTPHTSHLTLHTSHLTPHTSCLTPHTSHLIPQTSYLTLDTSHLTLHISHLTLHTSHFTPHTSHFTPHTSHFTPHTLYLKLHTSHFTPHTSHFTPHTSHLIPHYLIIIYFRTMTVRWRGLLRRATVWSKPTVTFSTWRLSTTTLTRLSGEWWLVCWCSSWSISRILERALEKINCTPQWVPISWVYWPIDTNDRGEMTSHEYPFYQLAPTTNC